jgi:23S rRNA (adenine2503-C2)-methyltransferase
VCGDYLGRFMSVSHTEPLQILEPGAPAHGRNDLRRNLIGLSRDGLKTALAEAGLEPFRAAQIWQWIYWHGVTDFGRMTNIAKKARDRLADQFVIERPSIVTEQRSTDGTRKWLLRFADGNEAETVNIPETDRGSLCVSSQVGCTLTCTFCHTGTQPLVRNLTPEEIVGQFMVARDRLRRIPADADRATPRDRPQDHQHRHDGHGRAALQFRQREDGAADRLRRRRPALSKRRITLSTSGVVPMIRRSASEIGVMLAISLHAVRDDLRDMLVPINKKYPIKELLAACRAYPGARNAAASPSNT